MAGARSSEYTYPERSNFGRIKEAVDLVEYASRYTMLHKSGKTLRGACPVHGGDSKDSFAVNPETRSWFCFREGIGGSVLDLHSRLHDCELWASALMLAEEYGVDLDEGRTEGWRRAQTVKNEAVSKAEHAIVSRLRRRIFKVLCAPYLRAAPSDSPELKKILEEDGDELWYVCGLIAREMRAKQRTSRLEAGGVR